MLLVLIDSLSSQTEEQYNTDTCYLNNNLTLQPPFHVPVSLQYICYDVTHLFVLPGSFMRTFSILPTLRTAWLIGVVFWSRRSSRGPNDAASRSPRVKGENSENRVFWSVREDLPALFCMLDFGPGVMEGRGERTRTCKSKKSNGRRVISATEDK